MEPVRLNRFLASAGLGSRRAVESLVAEGRVAINGVRAASPGERVGENDVVTVDGAPVAPERHVYVLLHKPPGVVTTASDPYGRPTVLELVDRPERLFPVGRLDADTTGVLLLTNDGALTQRLSHPSGGVPKTYEATVAGHIGPAALRRLRGGVQLEDGRTAPVEARVAKLLAKESVVELVLREGKNRQVRRMCEAVGYPVRALHRPRYGPLALGHLRPGDWRMLSGRELEALRGDG